MSKVKLFEPKNLQFWVGPSIEIVSQLVKVQSLTLVSVVVRLSVVNFSQRENEHFSTEQPSVLIFLQLEKLRLLEFHGLGMRITKKISMILC